MYELRYMGEFFYWLYIEKNSYKYINYPELREFHVRQFRIHK